MENVITIPKNVLNGLIVSYIRGYAFNNKGKKPKKIIVPYVDKVDGVVVEYEKEMDDGNTGN